MSTADWEHEGREAGDVGDDADALPDVADVDESELLEVDFDDAPGGEPGAPEGETGGEA
jgi:hypothetical protein